MVAQAYLGTKCTKHVAQGMSKYILCSIIIYLWQDMRLLGQTQHGVYDPDDCQDLDASLIYRYYSVDDMVEHQGSYIFQIFCDYPDPRYLYRPPQPR